MRSGASDRKRREEIGGDGEERPRRWPSLSEFLLPIFDQIACGLLQGLLQRQNAKSSATRGSDEAAGSRLRTCHDRLHRLLVSSTSTESSPTTTARGKGTRQLCDARYAKCPSDKLALLAENLYAELQRREDLRPPEGIAELEGSFLFEVQSSTAAQKELAHRITPLKDCAALPSTTYLLKRRRKLERDKYDTLRQAIGKLDERQLRTLARGVLVEMERRRPELADAGQFREESQHKRLSKVDSMDYLRWHKDLEKVVGSSLVGW